MEVTVNNVTVIITDYKPKKQNFSSTLSSSSPAAAAASSASMAADHKMNSTTQQALHERDGESKDSFSSNQTDTVFSGGEAESINGEITSSSTTAAES